jgi:hypothetical protein
MGNLNKMPEELLLLCFLNMPPAPVYGGVWHLQVVNLQADYDVSE